MQSPRTDEQRLFSLITGYRATQLVRIAVELGLPDLVGQEAISSAALARAVGVHAPSLRRVLRALVALGVFEETPDGGFVANALSDRLRRDVSGSLADLALGSPAEGYGVWASLLDSLRSGLAAYPRAFGRSFFEALADDPESAARFNRMMTSGTEADAAALVSAADLPDRGTVIDVGGGEGALIGAVLRARAGLDGILFDLPAGLAGARAYLEKAGVVDRCRLVEGSFLDSVPSADLYLLRRVLHDWDDEQAVGILRACARSMSSGGRLLVMETLLPEHVVAGPAAERVTLLDVHMLVLFGSRERSEAEYVSLLGRAGLRHTRTIPTGRPASVIVALKPAR